MANTTITALAAGTALAGTEVFETVQSATSVKATAAQIKTYATNLVISYQTPLVAFTITLGNSDDITILEPAGVLATGQITMPAAPVNGQVTRVSTTQTITALTTLANAGQTIKNAPTTLLAGGAFTYVYRSANTSWYRAA